MATETVKITGTSTGSHVSDHPYRIDLTVQLSLRDLFAAFALAGLLTNPNRDLTDQEYASEAFDLADAAIAARGLETTEE